MSEFGAGCIKDHDRLSACAEDASIGRTPPSVRGFRNGCHAAFSHNGSQAIQAPMGHAPNLLPVLHEQQLHVDSVQHHKPHLPALLPHRQLDDWLAGNDVSLHLPHPYPAHYVDAGKPGHEGSLVSGLCLQRYWGLDQDQLGRAQQVAGHVPRSDYVFDSSHFYPGNPHQTCFPVVWASGGVHRLLHWYSRKPGVS